MLIRTIAILGTINQECIKFYLRIGKLIKVIKIENRRIRI